VASGKLATIFRSGVLALALVGCVTRRPAAVVFLSDFGTTDDSGGTGDHEPVVDRVPIGEPLLYVDSWGRLALAINQGNLARSSRVVPPASLTIARKSR
jgi:hypothetical protein